MSCTSEIPVDLPIPDTYGVAILVVLASATVWAVNSVFLLLVFQCKRLFIWVLIFKAENHIQRISAAWLIDFCKKECGR